MPIFRNFLSNLPASPSLTSLGTFPTISTIVPSTPSEKKKKTRCPPPVAASTASPSRKSTFSLPSRCGTLFDGFVELAKAFSERRKPRRQQSWEEERVATAVLPTSESGEVKFVLGSIGETSEAGRMVAQRRESGNGGFEVPPSPALSLNGEEEGRLVDEPEELDLPPLFAPLSAVLSTSPPPAVGGRERETSASTSFSSSASSSSAASVSSRSSRRAIAEAYAELETQEDSVEVEQGVVDELWLEGLMRAQAEFEVRAGGVRVSVGERRVDVGRGRVPTLDCAA
ncbi:hypothetical protein JCM10213_003494 [Rhodosporidiobolus nylandii]